jgi:histidinol-phosphate aminotransferase
MLEPRTAVRTMKEYHPPLGGRKGLRLDFNENSSGCSPRVLARLQQIDAELLTKYPERDSVERTTAEHLGLAPEQVLLTNGVDEAIHLVCETYLEPGDEALIIVPTFSMYEIYVQATGATPVTIQAGEDFAFPTQSVLAAINANTKLIAIANPNNPTGSAVSRSDLLRIVEAAPNAAVLVDEAYFDFHGETLLDQIGRRDNLFLARTFSKAYGLAGLRVGVLCATASQMKMVKRVASPYNVNAIALACLAEALADRDYLTNYAAQVRRGRARLEAEFAALGFRYWPSHANFVLAHFGEFRQPFVAEMRRRGILVRDRHSDPGCAGCVRITIGTDEQTDRLLRELREVLAAISWIGTRSEVSR